MARKPTATATHNNFHPLVVSPRLSPLGGHARRLVQIVVFSANAVHSATRLVVKSELLECLCW